MKRFVFLLVCTGALSAQSSTSYDLVVYGATAGGVITSVSAARMGLKVALLEPRNSVGGMVSGGLSHTDVGRREVIGGYSLEFYWRAGRQYGLPQYLQDVAWYVEPKVAESIFRQMLREEKVTLLFERRLREKNGVRKQGTSIASITMENGAEYTARIFADCTYEGDLMAQAGISYTWGREGIAQYGESLAGVRGETPKHQFTVNLKHMDDAEVSIARPGETGAADRKVQAYNFRMIFSRDTANQTPFPKPAHYDPKQFDLMVRLLAALPSLKMGDVLSIGAIPNRKADINNNGPISTDYIGRSWDYPNASYRRRTEIWREHEDYNKGFVYFLAHDPRVPQALQKEVNEWGLAKDEFTSNGNFPNQLYIREARRMVGEFVMTQKDIQTALTKPDPIGMGSYNSDSHNIQRVINADGFIRNEGDMQVPVQPYQIPYRVLLPKKSEAGNLLVPVCFSASHVAYSTLRMEPQYMILGHAAGVAAHLAIKTGQNVQDIDTKELTRLLLAQGAIMEYVPSRQQSVLSLFRIKPVN
jgi:hypothetical protein